MDAEDMKFIAGEMRSLRDHVDNRFGELNDKMDASAKDLHVKIDTKTGELHSRISRVSEGQIRELHTVTDDQNGRIAALNSSLGEHKASPCPDVKEHERAHHGSSKVLKKLQAAKPAGGARLSMKLIAIITALITVLGTLAAAITKLIPASPPVPH